MKFKTENKKFAILITLTFCSLICAKGDSSSSSEESIFFVSCDNALRSNYSQGTGLYTILVHGDPHLVMCDDDMYGGNWLVFQRRMLGDVSFERGFNDYKNGFGTYQGDFWLGLDPLYQILSTRRHELILAMENWQEKKYFAKYDNFQLDGESNNYQIISLGSFSGNVLRDSFRKHIGKPFSVDNYCASRYKAGWWWANCYSANLNGVFPTDYYKELISEKKVMNWVTYNLHEPLRFVQMMIRPLFRKHADAIKTRTGNTKSFNRNSRRQNAPNPYKN